MRNSKEPRQGKQTAMSALLSEEDLNDFISPGLACVKPTEIKKDDSNTDENGELVVGKENELEKVSITLQDCLACVGCITSSEEILLSRQSYNVFLENYKKDPARPLVVSISPQSRLSIAEHLGMDIPEFDLKLCHLLRDRFDCRYVVGTQIGREITIQETNNAVRASILHTDAAKPKLCSVCPGFVLYCEKSKPQLLPHLLDIKSPQQFTGQIINKILTNPYHLSIMPCFDKKLEASRPENDQEVDCVITPKEFINMIQELDYTFTSVTDPSILQQMSLPGYTWHDTMATNAGSSSGGYAYQYVLQTRTLFQNKGINCEINSIQGKNNDLLEHRLIDIDTNATLCRSSEVYGFRNIQNMVRKLTQKHKPRTARIRKRAADPLIATTAPLDIDPYTVDFIEVMACPGGCINGGGLLNSNLSKKVNNALLATLNSKYHEQLAQKEVQPVDSTDYSLHYEFRPVEKKTDDEELLAMANW